MTPYPLAWPQTIPRWKRSRDAGQFKASLAAAINNVETSLRLFGKDSGKAVTEVVISSNATLGVSRPADPGVAIWFKWDGLSLCIPVDRVPCWGNRTKAPPMLRSSFHWLMQKLQASGKPMKAFGLSESGDPMHPLMLGYDTALIDLSGDTPNGQ